MSQLLWTDIALILIVLVSTLVSIKRGFPKELFSVINLGVAIFLAFRYSEAIANLVNSIIGRKTVTEAFAMTASFLIIYITATKLTNKIVRRAGKKGFSVFDRVLGIFFGFLRGVIIVVAIVALSMFSPLAKGDAWLKTPVTLKIKPYSDIFLGYIPPHIQNIVKKQIKEVDESPLMQQTKKLLNAVFGMGLELKQTTTVPVKPGPTTTQPAAQPNTDPNNSAVPNSPASPAAQQPNPPTVAAPVVQQITTEVQTIEKAPASDRTNIENTPLMKDTKNPPITPNDRQILLDKQKQLELERQRALELKEPNSGEKNTSNSTTTTTE